MNYMINLVIKKTKNINYPSLIIIYIYFSNRITLNNRIYFKLNYFNHKLNYIHTLDLLLYQYQEFQYYI